jgi:hypothetical protein
MAPRARSVHPLGPMKDWERSEAMVAGQFPDACARAVKATRVRAFPIMLICMYIFERNDDLKRSLEGWWSGSV